MTVLAGQARSSPLPAKGEGKGSAKGKAGLASPMKTSPGLGKRCP